MRVYLNCFNFFFLLGKGPSIWDHLSHTHPEMIKDHSNADIGPNSYHLFEKDIEVLKETKVL